MKRLGGRWLLRRLELLVLTASILVTIQLVFAFGDLRHAIASAFRGGIGQGWATLLGAVIGFSAIAWQTRQGFRNLRRSQ